MTMKLIKLISVFVLFMPLTAISKQATKYSNAYTKCVSSNVDNPMSTNCIDTEISAQYKEIKEIVLKNKDIVSPENGEVIDLNSYAIKEQKAIDNRCELWLKAGGQNGVLLEKQCVLDEVISLKIILSNFVSAVDG